MRQKIRINALPPSLNGKDGLMRMHWTKLVTLKKDWVLHILAVNPQNHEGGVKIRFTRLSTVPMDFDNIGASFKLVGDALVKNGVIKDDSPSIVTELVLRWKKASRKQQGVLIEIEDA